MCAFSYLSNSSKFQQSLRYFVCVKNKTICIFYLLVSTKGLKTHDFSTCDLMRTWKHVWKTLLPSFNCSGSLSSKFQKQQRKESSSSSIFASWFKSRLVKMLSVLFLDLALSVTAIVPKLILIYVMKHESCGVRWGGEYCIMTSTVLWHAHAWLSFGLT